MSPAFGEPDDKALVDRVVAGESEVFAALIKRHQKAVFGLGLGFFKNEEDTGDFVQDVFLKAYRNLPGFQGKSKFSTWLYRIAYNTALNAVKRRREYQSLAEDMEIPDFDDPQTRTLREASRAAIRTALDELPERYRICLDLYFFYDLSYPEIEGVTGFPVNTIKSHVFRAKALLRDKLRDEAEGGTP
jgi:RNA polymerase sigma-70 factor (ECF subfamily)